MSIYKRSGGLWPTSYRILRPSLDSDLDSILIQLHGGRKTLQHPSGALEIGTASDWGGLSISSLVSDPFQRTISALDQQNMAADREQLLFEDALEMIPYLYWHDDELTDLMLACRRPSGSMVHHPNCNDFHQFDLGRDYSEVIASADYDSYLVSQGFYRDVWVHSKPMDHPVKTILKTTRTKFDFNYRNLMDVQREALVMDRLATSDHIVTGLGHCGASLLVEAVPFEVEEYVVPGTGYHESGLINEPRNSFEPREKLQMALEMAESLAELHGYMGGVMVHGDVQLSQWLRTRDGRVKLGDFNSARSLEWNEQEQRYCDYSTGTVFGNVSIGRTGRMVATRVHLTHHDIYSFDRPKSLPLARSAKKWMSTLSGTVSMDWYVDKVSIEHRSRLVHRLTLLPAADWHVALLYHHG